MLRVLLTTALLLVGGGTLVRTAAATDIPCFYDEGHENHCFHDPEGYPCMDTPDGGTCRYCEAYDPSPFCQACAKPEHVSADCRCYDLECQIVWGYCGQAGDSTAYACWSTYYSAGELIERKPQPDAAHPPRAPSLPVRV